MEHERFRKFSNSDELMKFLRERTDDIEQLVIPVQPAIRIRQADGRSVGITKGVGAVIKLCNGDSMVVQRDDAARLINDGILQRMGIKCVLDTLDRPD